MRRLRSERRTVNRRAGMISRSGGQAIIEVNNGKAERLDRSFPHNGLRKLFAASKWGLFMLCA